MDSDPEVEQEADELPSLSGLPDATTSRRLERAQALPLQDASSVLPAVSATKSEVLGTPLRRDKNAVAAFTPSALGLPSIPPPLTPSINQVLSPAPDAPPPPPLPAGLTVASLRGRLDGKKKIKYVQNLWFGERFCVVDDQNSIQGCDLDAIRDGGFD